MALVFNPNVLASGVSYNFVLKASNTEGEAEAEIVIQTNGPPSEGVFETVVEEVNGSLPLPTALKTQFTIKVWKN